MSTLSIVPYVRRPRFVLEGLDDGGTTPGSSLNGSWESTGGGVGGGGGLGWEVDDCLQGLVKWNPYWVLGVPPDDRPLAVSLACPKRLSEIHNAYLDLSKRMHPDSRVDSSELR